MKSQNFRRTVLAPSLAAALAVSTSGCLKTRAQMKNDDDGGPSRPVPAQVQDVTPQGGYVIDEIKGEITRLTGRIEDLEREQRQSSSKEKGPSVDDLKKLENRIIELENAQAQMIEELKKAQAQAAPPADPNELIERAKEQLEQGQLDKAIENLSAYLKIPKAKNPEEATFLRAEAYYQQKQYKKAIVDYSKFPEKWGKSKRVPAALYKIGQSFEALGMKEDAKGFYQELVEKFPKSAEAKKAKKKAR